MSSELGLEAMVTTTWRADLLPIELILDRDSGHVRLQARTTDDWHSDPWHDIQPSLTAITELLTNYALSLVSNRLVIPNGDFDRIPEALAALETKREDVRRAAAALAREAYIELFMQGRSYTNAA